LDLDPTIARRSPTVDRNTKRMILDIGGPDGTITASSDDDRRENAVPRPSTSPRSAAAAAAPASVRQRAAHALADSTALESVLDRVVAKRLRPLRADVTAARKAYEEQVVLRVEAQARAERLAADVDRLAAEGARLRRRVEELEQELAAAQRRTGWFRRGQKLRAQEA
jgi:hypothetical protein